MPNFMPIIFELSAGASGPTNWRRLSWTTPATSRMITGSLTTGDSIQVQFTLEKLTGERNVMETSVSAQTYAPSSTYTSTIFEFGYTGAPAWVRVIKTGTAGVARVVLEG
jgi:hypothetical protein